MKNPELDSAEREIQPDLKRHHPSNRPALLQQWAVWCSAPALLGQDRLAPFFRSPEEKMDSV